MTFSFLCATCNELHHGMPSFGAEAPFSYDQMPAEDRERRCSLGSDDCVIDERQFFVRGCLEMCRHAGGRQSELHPKSWTPTFGVFSCIGTPSSSDCRSSRSI
ncbi:DUF2199 domain-containing protein [Cupriavidus pauculus]|uniref:Uncharacterized protein n=1 Tax=Cupriavidus pauculus TaxID=82633 RepID=A0A2N5C716_9BURK|nr:DUF2199 domain-containing protein [Cupriavidus pauculus]PLP98014.1 hypothetical protein CYJ10_24475 [Cupriavidus pauculus]